MLTRGRAPSGLPWAAWALCSGRAVVQTLNAAEKCCTRQTHWRKQGGQRCLARGYESLAPVSDVFRKGLAAIRRQQETSAKHGPDKWVALERHHSASLRFSVLSLLGEPKSP